MSEENTESEVITGIEAPIYLKYNFTAGAAPTRFLTQLKKGKLTEWEFAVMQRHTELGAVVLPILWEEAAAGDALDVTLVGEFAQGPVRRHARYLHTLDEFVLGRHAVVRAQFARGYLRDDQVLELLVARFPAVAHRFAPTAAAAARNASRVAAPDLCSPSATSHSPCTITPSIGRRYPENTSASRRDSSPWPVSIGSSS